MSELLLRARQMLSFIHEASLTPATRLENAIDAFEGLSLQGISDDVWRPLEAAICQANDLWLDAIDSTELEFAGPSDESLSASLQLLEFESHFVDAFSTIVETISLPGEGPSELFGDAVGCVFSRILAQFADPECIVIEKLIVNRDILQPIRWDALHAL